MVFCFTLRFFFGLLGLVWRFFCVLGFFFISFHPFRDRLEQLAGKRLLRLLPRLRKPFPWTTWIQTTICPVTPVRSPDWTLRRGLLSLLLPARVPESHGAVAPSPAFPVLPHCHFRVFVVPPQFWGVVVVVKYIETVAWISVFSFSLCSSSEFLSGSFVSSSLGLELLLDSSVFFSVRVLIYFLLVYFPLLFAVW